MIYCRISHNENCCSLYKRLTSKKTYQGDDDEEGRSELEYLKFIRDIRDDQPELFQKIKLLPKKARSARDNDVETDQLLTFFRKGKLKKFSFRRQKFQRAYVF